MDTIAISDARNNLPKLIDDVADYMKRFVISVSGEPKAVLISAEELESLEETAEILSDPGTYESIMKGHKQAKARKGMLLNHFLVNEKSIPYRTSAKRSKRNSRS
jgi:prevent-host-death family protein